MTLSDGIRIFYPHLFSNNCLEKIYSAGYEYQFKQFKTCFNLVSLGWRWSVFFFWSIFFFYFQFKYLIPFLSYWENPTSHNQQIIPNIKITPKLSSIKSTRTGPDCHPPTSLTPQLTFINVVTYSVINIEMIKCTVSARVQCLTDYRCTDFIVRLFG